MIEWWLGTSSIVGYVRKTHVNTGLVAIKKLHPMATTRNIFFCVASFTVFCWLKHSLLLFSRDVINHSLYLLLFRRQLVQLQREWVFVCVCVYFLVSVHKCNDFVSFLLTSLFNDDFTISSKNPFFWILISVEKSFALLRRCLDVFEGNCVIREVGNFWPI